MSQIGQGVGLVLAGLGVAVGFLKEYPWPVTVAIALVLFGFGLVVVSAVRALSRRRTTATNSGPRPTTNPDSKVAPLHHVIDQTFVNATVVLDGVRYSKCTFRNCTIQWLGGAWGGWDDKCVFENVRYQTIVPGALQAIDQLKGLGFLSDEFAKSWGPEIVRIVGIVADPGNRGS